ncbi:MAG: hypothetical protein ABL921_18795 [Pirellula sp.]
MAVRIPVVVCQSERRAGGTADYEEELITRLIFENGLDATLVADLKSIQLDTTDHLCIEGLKGDFAVASWESPQYVCEHLHRLGMPSIVMVPLNGAPKLESIRDGLAPKKIFFVALSTSTTIDSTIQSLQDLRQARSIPVVSLGLTHVAKPIPETSAGAVKSPPVVDKDSSPFPGTTALSSQKPPMESAVANSKKDSEVECDEFPNIDELMNDLDQFEL